MYFIIRFLEPAKAAAGYSDHWFIKIKKASPNNSVWSQLLFTSILSYIEYEQMLRLREWIDQSWALSVRYVSYYK